MKKEANKRPPHPIFLGSEIDPRDNKLIVRFEYGPDLWHFKPEDTLARLGSAIAALHRLDDERRQDAERMSKLCRELARREREGEDIPLFQLSAEEFTEERINAATSSIHPLILDLSKMIGGRKPFSEASNAEVMDDRFEKVIESVVRAVTDGCQEGSRLVLLPIVLMVGNIPTITDVLDFGIDRSKIDIPMKTRLREIAEEMKLPLGYTINPKKRQRMFNKLRAEGYRTTSESVRKTLYALGFYAERQPQQ